MKGPIGFEEIIPREQFDAADKLRGRWRKKIRDRDEMLSQIRALLAQHGNLSIDLLAKNPDLVANRDSFRRYFGGMRQVYALIGYVPPPPRGFHNTTLNQHFKIVVAEQVNSIVIALRKTFKSVEWVPSRHYISIEERIRVAVVIARYLPTRQRARPAWRVKTLRKHAVDMMVVIRMDHENSAPLDYYVFAEGFSGQLWLAFFGDTPRFESQRCDTSVQVIARITAKCSTAAVPLKQERS